MTYKVFRPTIQNDYIETRRKGTMTGYYEGYASEENTRYCPYCGEMIMDRDGAEATCSVCGMSFVVLIQGVAV